MGVNPVLPTPSQTLAPRIKTAVLCVGIAFLILVAVLLVRPSGILGTPDVDRV